MKLLAYFMLYGVVGMIFALVVYTFVFELTKLIVYKMIGGEFVSFVFLFFNIKNENGRIVLKSTNPQLISKCTVNPPEGLSEEKDTKYGLISAILPFVVFLAILLLTFNFSSVFVKVMLIEAIVISLLFLCFILNMVIKGKDNAPMAEYLNKTAEYRSKLKSGIRPRDLELIGEEPEVKRYAVAKELTPILIRYWHYLDKGEYDKLTPYINIFNQSIPNFNNSDFNGVLFELIFYRSFIERDTPAAQNIVAMLEGELENNKDSNGRRVYAYFLYYTNKGRDRALQVANEGLEYIEDYRHLHGATADMEGELLSKLIKTIEEEKGMI
ncbi:MAG: hypothetical protein IJS61_04135 [Firmicutes bacterium]|nr:hypothetical protein [Bacillota bacterium]